MKGVDIVVGGNIGHMSAFMAQAGRLVVCGDAGEALGDSIYEARIYVRGDGRVARRRLHREGDARRAPRRARRAARRRRASTTTTPATFTPLRLGPQLYHFHVDNASCLLMD